jgi:hypothetical protein
MGGGNSKVIKKKDHNHDVYYTRSDIDDFRTLGLTADDIYKLVEVFMKFGPELGSRMISMDNFYSRLGVESNIMTATIFDTTSDVEDKKLSFYSVSGCIAHLIL